jgi:hypothetical protein
MAVGWTPVSGPGVSGCVSGGADRGGASDREMAHRFRGVADVGEPVAAGSGLRRPRALASKGAGARGLRLLSCVSWRRCWKRARRRWGGMRISAGCWPGSRR